MEKIKLTNILDNTPHGLKLWCDVYGEVAFDSVDKENVLYKYPYPIKCKQGLVNIEFTKTGAIAFNISEEDIMPCVLWPSENHRSWDNWQAVLFNPGDVVVEGESTAYIVGKHCFYTSDGVATAEIDFLYQGSRYATKEEKDKFFSELSENGYEWDGERVVKKKHNMKQEPKFHIGDWVAINPEIGLTTPLLIKDVDETNYLVECLDGSTGCPSIDHIEKHYHKWTVNDAKPGDVIIEHAGTDDAVAGIFEEYVDIEGCRYISLYCSADNYYFNTEFDRHNEMYDLDAICPADKKTRDYLFTKMHDACWSWNKDKLELEDMRNKPKFGVGDWIIRSEKGFKHSTYLVKEVKDYYLLEYTDGQTVTLTLNDVNNNFSLWETKDIKPGDILKEESCTFIVKDVKSDGVVRTHCCLFDDGDFIDDGSVLYFDTRSTVPATKEQRDILFEEMRKHDYEWNQETLEMNKIINNDGNHPNGCIVMEDFTEGDGLYKMEINYLAKDRVEIIENLIREWNKETDCKQEPVDIQPEQKPKFSDGDWIVSDMGAVCHIVGVTGQKYTLHIINDDYHTFESDAKSIDTNYRLWNIKDAKRGDILSCKNFVFIYDGYERNSEIVTSFCDAMLDGSGFTHNPSYNMCNGDHAHPATKEECRLLYKMMSDAGYEWNSGEFRLINKETMTLEDAIKHCEEKSCGNSECNRQHQQLAEWLKELKHLREDECLNNDIEQPTLKDIYDLLKMIYDLQKHIF